VPSSLSYGKAGTMGERAEQGRQDAVWPEDRLGDPNNDPCVNCGRPRREHKMTRGGAVCLNGRRFKLDRERMREALAALLLPRGQHAEPAREAGRRG
jgi:hypothetical protein